MSRSRKFFITILGIVCFSVIVLVKDQVEPISLGVPMTGMLTSFMWGNRGEHKFSGENKSVKGEE